VPHFKPGKELRDRVNDSYQEQQLAQVDAPKAAAAGR
jgi:hypothetical protein